MLNIDKILRDVRRKEEKKTSIQNALFWAFWVGGFFFLLWHLAR